MLAARPSRNLAARVVQCEARLTLAITQLDALRAGLQEHAGRLSGVEREIETLCVAARTPGQPDARRAAGAQAGIATVSAMHPSPVACWPAGRRRRSPAARARNRAARVRRWLLVALVLSVAAAGWIVLAPGSGPTSAGFVVVADTPTVVRLRGRVEIDRPGQAGPLTIDAAAGVRNDDALSVAQDAEATLTWPNGAVATVAGPATVQLSPGAPEALELVVRGGTVWVDGGPARAATHMIVAAGDGVRAEGPRFWLRRDESGRALVQTADAAVAVSAYGARQEVPPGATSEVLPAQRPSLARPVSVGRALAVTVDGARAWMLIDEVGRAVGAPPGGGPWLDYLPGARGPLGRARGGGLVVPDAQGLYRVLVWGERGEEAYRVAAWIADGQAAYGGPAPVEAANAVRYEGMLAAGRVAVARLEVPERGQVRRGDTRELVGLPDGLRLAVAPAPSTPAGTVAGGLTTDAQAAAR